MSRKPQIRTRRLLLRSFMSGDAPIVAQLCNEPDIAATTLNIPHPYTVSMASEWIKGQREREESMIEWVWAITRPQHEGVVGAVGLVFTLRHARGELGYWIGKPFWNQGYCTEAARAVLSTAFEELEMNRVHASHFERNPASGRVMEKIGMHKEGVLRQHYQKGSHFEDVVTYGILISEFRKMSTV